MTKEYPGNWEKLPRFVTIPQASRYLNVSRATIYRMISAGTLPAARVKGHRAIRIPSKALDDCFTWAGQVA